ncbi:O-antigen ligase family protein [Lysinibacillus irui]|uniref:O-antigen ligase family protein n=1 Tax=Lysinibacillus irui TaxID=2998077 RepID=UPI002AD4FBF4|nr:O-antigen ligase family protein [Lysinibacillus irui]MEA0561907.1 O-antigen ligase family protein [Lysinibacillus irui]
MSKFYEKVTYRDVEEDIQSQKSVDKWIFWLLLIVIGFVPLIVMASVVEVQSPLITNVSALEGGTKGDIFTHYKALVLVVISILAGIMFMAKIVFMNGEIRKTKMNYVIGAFAVAIVLSTIFSPNISIALHGQYNRSDGAISWLCYLALFFIALNINYPKKVLNYILYSLYPFVIINLYIIIMNFYDNDLLQKAAVKRIVTLFLPAEANIGEDSILVGTLNQWNYMSGAFAIMTVLFLAAALFEKNIVRSIIHMIIALFALSIVFMSLSSSGFITIVLLFPLLIFYVFKSKTKKQSVLVLSIFLILSVPIFHTLATHVPKVWYETIGLIFKYNPYDVYIEPESTSYKFNSEEILLTKAYAAEKFELPVLPDRATAAGSGRAYIWGKGFDLLKERPLLGYGLDTFMYNFPHYDIDARAGLYDENTITDKPHSMYFSLLYGTGIIGFLCATLLIAMSLIRSLKVVIKQNEIIIWVLGIAWGAYLIQAFFNDSLPGTSAIMWLIAGIMLAETYTNKEQLNGRDD